MEKNYSLPAKLFHWGFVVVFVYGVLKSVDNLEQLDDSSFLRFEVLFALGFILMLIVRFVYMWKTQHTSLPTSTNKVQKLAAKIVHLAMYISLALVALTGLMIGLLFWLGFEDGLVIELIIGAHEFVIPVLYWLIAIHVAAAIFHRFKKDGVWNSMVPFWREGS